jgi:hypothetical protein
VRALLGFDAQTTDHFRAALDADPDFALAGPGSRSRGT